MPLIDCLPLRLRREEIGQYQRSMEPLTEEMWAALEDFERQLSPLTSTGWGLELWERSLGLAVDVESPIEFRRTRVISKLRGSGTTTVEALKNVAESFSNGQVEVVEYPAEYRFEVRFVSQIGIPPNMEDLTAAIDEVKPAHLAYTYICTYATWGMHQSHLWADLEGWTWDEVLHGAAIR